MLTKIFCFLLLVASGLLKSPSCGEHSYYDPCGTYCPPTCQVPTPDACPDACRADCFCEEGYIKENLNGECIPRNECEASCREHELYQSCGTPCPPTCANPDPQCTITVCGTGCFCEDGYILDNAIESQTCVAREACPMVTAKKFFQMFGFMRF